VFGALLIIFSLLSYFKHLILLGNSTIVCNYCDEGRYYAVIILLFFLFGVIFSLSFTNFITLRVARLCGDGGIRNLILFISMLIINYILLILWSPVANGIKELFTLMVKAPFFVPPYYLTSNELFEFIRNILTLMSWRIDWTITDTYSKLSIEYFLSRDEIDSFALCSLYYFPSLFRFILIDCLCRLVYVKAAHNAPYISCLGTDY
jgi:hypothetical protein